MKKILITFITAAALALAIPLYAADYSEMESNQMITADELQGMEVVSQEGKKIGEIEKITIDSQSGQVQFIIFSTSGILGMEKENVAAPLNAFEFNNDQATLTVDQSKLYNCPQQKAEVTDTDYRRNLETHYGVAPAWDEPMTEKARAIPKNDGGK